MCPIRFGGKTADEIIYEKMPKQERAVVKNPLPVPRNESQQHLISVLCDVTMWTEQYLDEMAKASRIRYNLAAKIKAPHMADHPGRPAAVQRYKQLGHDLTRYANDITELEAQADRTWQAMTEQSRITRAMDWQADPTEPRLIGKAWLGMARQFQWPDYFVFDPQVLRQTHKYIRDELEAVVPDVLPLGKAEHPF